MIWFQQRCAISSNSNRETNRDYSYSKGCSLSIRTNFEMIDSIFFKTYYYANYSLFMEIIILGHTTLQGPTFTYAISDTMH